MKKLTRERVVPIIWASVSWLIFASNWLRIALLAKICEKKKEPGKPLLAGIEELIDQVRLYANSTSQQMGDEHLRERRLVMKQAQDRWFLDPRNYRVCHGHGCQMRLD